MAKKKVKNRRITQTQKDLLKLVPKNISKKLNNKDVEALERGFNNARKQAMKELNLKNISKYKEKKLAEGIADTIITNKIVKKRNVEDLFQYLKRAHSGYADIIENNKSFVKKQLSDNDTYMIKFDKSSTATRRQLNQHQIRSRRSGLQSVISGDNYSKYITKASLNENKKKNLLKAREAKKMLQHLKKGIVIDKQAYSIRRNIIRNALHILDKDKSLNKTDIKKIIIGLTDYLEIDLNFNDRHEYIAGIQYFEVLYSSGDEFMDKIKEISKTDEFSDYTQILSDELTKILNNENLIPDSTDRYDVIEKNIINSIL